MTKRKILALVLTLVLVITQFAMLNVSAEELSDATNAYEALSGREEFLMGVNIHHFVNTPSYTETYSALCDAENLGSNIVRINGSPADEANYSYFKSVADAAADKGMQTMLANVGFANYVSVTETVDGVKTIRPRTIEELDLAAITAHYTEMATAFKGSVKYYQLGNEMDNIFYTGGDFGREYSIINYEDVTVAAMAIDAATKAIKAADPDAKVIVNFVSQHLGFIHGLKAVDIDSATEGVQTASWDYIGMDWYSNMSNKDSINPEDGEPYDYTDNINDLAKYDEPVIICEANLHPSGWNEEDHSQVYYGAEASWLADFVTYCYGNDEVAGFIAYELWDEPEKRAYDENGNEVFSKEAHYGLIDKNGNKKETYNVLQALYGGTDVARESIPAVTNTETVGEVINTTLSSAITGKITKNFNDKTIIMVEKFEAVDFSNLDLIEFDLYVEDADALKSAMENAGAMFRVYINGNETYRGAEKVPAYKIKNDGWNHIVLSKSNFSVGGDPWSAVDSFKIEFVGAFTPKDAPTYMNAASGMNVAVANLSATKLTKTTESTVGTVTFTAGSPYAGRFGNNNGYYFGLYNDFKQKGVIPSDTVTTSQYFEFDIYIDNYEALIEGLKNDTRQNLGLYFCISNRTDDKIAIGNVIRWNITNLIKGDGWNHIVVHYGGISDKNPVEPWTVISPSGSSLRSYQLAFIDNNGTLDTKGTDDVILTSNNSPTVGGELGFDMFAMTNVIGSNYSAPESDTLTTPVATLSTDTALKEIGTRFDYTSTNTTVKDIESTDLSTAEYIEFDFFVESYPALKREMEAKGPTNMSLLLSSDPENMYNASIKFPFFDQVKHSGWNHIIVPNTTSSKCDESAIVAYYLYFNGTIKVANTYSAMKIAVANIQGTSLIKPDMENVANSEVRIYDDMKAISLGTNFKSAVLVDLEQAVNTKFASNNPTYLEFDLFVLDYEKFISASVNNDLVLRISSNAESYNRDSLTTRNVQNYITKSGWNHIQIPFSAFAKGSTEGTFNAAALKQFRFYFGGTASNSTGVAQGMKFAVANLAATADKMIPDDIMPEHTAIADDVLSFTFDGDGQYLIDLSETPKDISNDRLLEMDVYVNGESLSAFTVMLVDTTGEGYATYTFENLVAGWNHLALRLDDLYNEGLNETQIAMCVLMSDAGAKVDVANFYTANYVDGDGTRDGKTDIIDLIRSTKISLGTETKGNIVALDLVEGDYEVKAEDISALRRLLLS